MSPSSYPRHITTTRVSCFITLSLVFHPPTSWNNHMPLFPSPDYETTCLSVSLLCTVLSLSPYYRNFSHFLFHHPRTSFPPADLLEQHIPPLSLSALASLYIRDRRCGPLPRAVPPGTACSSPRSRLLLRSSATTHTTTNPGALSVKERLPKKKTHIEGRIQVYQVK